MGFSCRRLNRSLKTPPAKLGCHTGTCCHSTHRPSRCWRWSACSISQIPPKHLSKTASGSAGVVRRSVTPSRSSNMDSTPNTNIHTIVRAQIVFLLSTLTEENFERNQAEIRSVRVLFLIYVTITDIAHNEAVRTTWNRNVFALHTAAHCSLTAASRLWNDPSLSRHVIYPYFSTSRSRNTATCARPYPCRPIS